MQEYIIYKVQDQEDKQSIADMFKVNISNIVSDKKQLEAGDRVIINMSQANIHIVKPGETLETIASFYDIDKQIIIKKNKITRLFVGQQLFI